MSDFITPDLICGLLNAAVVVGSGRNAQTCDERRAKGSFLKKLNRNHVNSIFYSELWRNLGSFNIRCLGYGPGWV